jgi:hypothetical protein
MPELERRLRELGGAIEFPATPALAPAVRRRIAEAPARRTLPFPGRRALVLAFAVLVVAVGAVMAVPQARTAILEWLGLRGVSIERTETAPTAPPGATLALGRPVDLDEAKRRAGFDVRVPSDLGEPDEVYLAFLGAGDQVTLLWHGEDGSVEALLTQLVARVHGEFVINKATGPGTSVETLTVDGGRAFWLEGDPHLVAYVDPEGGFVEDTVRLAGNVLLWERGDVTLRLEGDFERDEALEIARSIG